MINAVSGIPNTNSSTQPTFGQVANRMNNAPAGGTSSPSPSSNMGKKSGFSPRMLIGAVVMFLLLLGGGVGLYLSQQSQDVRQQASTGGLQEPSQVTTQATDNKPCTMKFDVTDNEIITLPTTSCTKVAYQDEFSNTAGKYTYTTPKTSFEPGDNVVFKIDVTRNSAAATQGLNLRDVLSGSGLDQFTFLDSTCGDGAYDAATKTLKCTVGAAVTDPIVTIGFRVKISASITSELSITNKADVIVLNAGSSCQATITVKPGTGGNTPVCGSDCYSDTQCPDGHVCRRDRNQMLKCMLSACANGAKCSADSCQVVTDPACGSTCTKDSECPTDHSCSNNKCVLAKCTVAGTACSADKCQINVCGSTCSADTQCPNNHTCQNNKCVLTTCANGGNCSADKCTPITQTACGDSCTQNSDCPNNHTCSQNKCVLTACTTGSSCTADKCAVTACGSTCSNNSECPNDHTCSGGKCVLTTCANGAACTNDKCAQTACGSTCSANTECPNDHVCSGGKCVLETCADGASCTSNKCQTTGCGSSCSANSECPNDHTCSGGKCVLDTCLNGANCSSNKCTVIKTEDDDTPDQTPAVGCNQACASNADCQSSSHICVDTSSGKRCRLETNISSTSCRNAGTSTPTNPGTPTTQQPGASAQPNLPEKLPVAGSTDIIKAFVIGLFAVILGIVGLLLI